MRTFIVELWARVFSYLRRLSISYWIEVKLILPEYRYLFVEAWVLGNLLCACVGVVIAVAFAKFPILINLLSLYAVLRVLEIIIHQANIILFDEYRTRKAGRKYAVRGFRRITILSLHNYVEIILWYAILFLRFNDSFENGTVKLHSILQVISYSFHTLTTFGYEGTVPSTTLGQALVLSEAIAGVFMVVIILARFLSLIPAPGTLDEFEQTS